MGSGQASEREKHSHVGLSMEPKHEYLQEITRRNFLKATGQFSLGAIALAGHAGLGTQSDRGCGGESAGAKEAALEPKVKRVIYLHMSGGPPHSRSV